VKEKLKEALLSRQKNRITDKHRVSSAVLIPLFIKDGQYHILFIQRTNKVKDHKGQIAFPGGSYEKSDRTLQKTALREAQEEVGIAPVDVEMLGELDDIRTIGSSYIISPFVAVIPWPYQLKLDDWETEETIEVPISALLDENCLSKSTDILDDQLVQTYFYNYKGKVIWGATARILYQFLNIVAPVMRGK